MKKKRPHPVKADSYPATPMDPAALAAGLAGSLIRNATAGEMIDRRIRIAVSEADIARAKRNDSFKCVVSQAIARTLPAAHRIEVDTQNIRFSEGPVRYIYNTPPAVQGYVVAFDAGDPPEPFAFQLRYARRIVAKRKVATAAGRAADRARSQVVHRAQRRGETATKADLKAAYHKARAQYPGQKLRTIEGGPEAQRPIPRVFKTGLRHYGHRALRVNWPKEKVEPAAVTSA